MNTNTLLVLGLGAVGVAIASKYLMQPTPYRDWGFPHLSAHPRKPYYVATSYLTDEREFPGISCRGSSNYRQREEELTLSAWPQDQANFPSISGSGGSSYGDFPYARSGISRLVRSYGRFGLLTGHGNVLNPWPAGAPVIPSLE